MQKAAFQALQLQKDAVHGYIRNQVCVVGWGEGQTSHWSLFLLTLIEWSSPSHEKLCSKGCGLLFFFVQSKAS